MARKRGGSSLRYPPRRGPLDRVVGLRLGTLLKWTFTLALLAGVLALAAFVAFVLYPVRTIPPLEQVDDYVYLDQGWGTAADSAARQTYYYTPQGTSMPQGALLAPLRYAWFVNLEMPLDENRFADAAHLQRYRFLVDPEPTARNPDRLPVGFTRHFDTALGEYVLDITCAACHTGEIHVRKDGRTQAIRIDGGQAMHAFTSMQRGAFGPTLVASMLATWADPWKFERFARKVIGPRYPQGASNLRGQLWDTIKAFATQGQDSPFRHLYPMQEGYGRTDALGRIANTVFGDHLVPGNYQVATAPVSYPYLWNIWKFDWVQYNGSVKQPLARNIGEALGVGAVLRLTDTYGNPLPAEQRFDSSVIVPNLDLIERTLQTLQPPRWPEHLLGAVDPALAARGKALFESHCQGCHGPHPAGPAQQQANAPGKTLPGTEWHIEVIPVEHIGTDPAEAVGFVMRRYDLTHAGLTKEDVSRVLRPLLLRQLARDVRWRLREVIDARVAAGGDASALVALLDAYPDPDADAQAVLPLASFAAIAAELVAASPEPPAASEVQASPAIECTRRVERSAIGASSTAATLGDLERNGDDDGGARRCADATHPQTSPEIECTRRVERSAAGASSTAATPGDPGRNGDDDGGARRCAAATHPTVPACDAACQVQALRDDVTGGAQRIERQLADIDVASLSEGQGLNILGLMIKAKYFADNAIPYTQQQCIGGFGILDLPQQVAGYKPRPLEGVWATPPFLHNGSVPSVYQMLLPPEQRSKRFLVGHRDYDPKHLGYTIAPTDGGDGEGFWLDTGINGNRNTGHAFIATPEQLAASRSDPKAHPLPSGVIGPLLADEERWAIIEYLKVHRDLPATPEGFVPPECSR